MDPLFLNLGLPQQAAAVAPASTTPVTNQVNGLPQESKLATYLSNRQQLSTSTQQPQQQEQPPLTNSVAALSLDGVGTREVSVSSVSSVAEFVPGSGGGGGLAHSSSTPSFHSFSGLGSPSLSNPSSLGFTPLTRSSPAATVASPQRPRSPQDSPSRGRCSPQSGGGEDNSNASNLSTYQENVGGTTYFFTTQDQPSFGASGAATSPASFTTGPQPSLVFPPYHILPATPSHVHHLRAPNNTPHFFMGDELRNELLERHALTLAHVDPEQFPDIPREIDMYHELVPLEPQHGVNKSSIFGYSTSVYKGTNIKTGLRYCLYRIHGFRLSNVKVTQLVDLWKKLQHSSVTQLREVFTTKAFNDNSIVFVYDYHAGAETLASRHFSSTNALTANGWEGLASSAGGNGSSTSHDTPVRGIHRTHRQNSGSSLLPESTLWNYIIQLTGALRTIHTQGLACRTLDPTKILLTDNKARIRVNCCGIHDVLNFDANVANPLASMPQYQQEDLVNLGKLMVALACNSVLALQRDNIQTALELINRSYSRDLAMLVVCLLTSQRIKSINDVMPMIGARFYTALETATQRADAYETEISKEVHNGRLFRLLTKLNTIVDRPQLHLDTSWSETGDRYMLKLFRDYVFHQVTEDGRPWLDLAHVVSVLNKLDAGSPDKMESFDFVIPLSLDALQESTSTRQYVVTNISISREIPKKIQEAHVLFRQDGPKFIIREQCFDAFYSVLVNFASVDDEFKHRSLEILIKAMGKVAAELALLLDGEMSGRDKLSWLNVLKMTTYLACNLTEAFENNYNKPTTDTLLLGKSRKKTNRTSDDGMDWEEERNHMLLQFFSVLQYPLQRLWEPPIMEEDFVNLIANCCYKILESPSMNLARTKPTRDSIFQIIGTLIKKFNHGLGCALKLMQLLQHFEHMVTPAAQGVILLVESFGIKSVVAELVREISKVDARDLLKDTSGLRNFSQFLVEVSDKCPQVVMPSLSLLINFLHEEAQSMRNCVLSILGSLVLKVLSGEDLDLKSKELRDQCLDHLEDHIHDVHAFVRSKVLQIWNDLITEKAVPLRRQHKILKLVLGRLQDKSSTVRKNAVQLLTAFVKGNPFAAKLPLEELQSQYEIELKKLQEMSPGIILESSGKKNTPVEKTVTTNELWNAMLPEVVDSIREIIKEGGSDDGEDTLEDGASLNDAVSDVAEALKSSKIRRAVKLLEAAFESFSGAEILVYDPEDYSSISYKEISKKLTENQMRYLVVLERIFKAAEEMERIKDSEKSGEKMDEDEANKNDSEETEKNSEETEKNSEEKEKEKEINAEIAKQKLLVIYLKDSVGFAKLIHKGLPVVCQLMGSKIVSDVLEAVSFFVTAFEFGLLNAMTGVRRMLALVWSKEQGIKSAVVEAYQRLYININSPNDRTRALHIISNLSALITGATLGERTSMEEIITQFVTSGDITKQCVTLLWERCTKTLPDTTDDEARSALILLAMCANSEVSIISSNIGVLVNSGLGERGEQDFALVKETCTALLKLAVTKPKTDAPTAPFRLDRDHEIFERLSKILVKGLTILHDRQYSPMAIEAVSTIYALAEHPDLICGEVIKQMSKEMLELPNEEPDPESECSTPQVVTLQVPVGVLSRFYVVLGHVALRQLIHLDTFIFSELKRRNFLREEMETEKKIKKKRKNKRKSHATSASEVSRVGSQEGDIDEEMGLTGAVADDMEAEYIRSICETEIITGDNLLATLRPMIWAVCSNPGKYPDPELRTAATLALAKFMMVSSDICEENLQLLFTILEKSEEAVIRANIVIALGDLSFRFPNQLEPWTPRLYARLRDDSPKVRQNTLTILTHLVLNDMVKVKGLISDIALCINDEDPRISGLANLFFNELARKGNALYNVLPDIMSRLSDAELGIEEQHFRTIIGHIFSLIQKDKQQENLVEKLCHRFQATINTRQWRDIAYCLSLLQFNEKSIRKLSENFSCYSDKMHEPEVFDFFLGILANAQKTAKPESKVLIEELEGRIQESHDKGVEDENVINKAANAKSKFKKPRHPAQSAKIRRRKPKESSSEEEEEDVRNQLHPAHRNNKENSVRRSVRRSKTTIIPKHQKKIVDEDSDDNFKGSSSSGSDEKELPRKTVRIVTSKPLAENHFRPTRSNKRK